MLDLVNLCLETMGEARYNLNYDYPDLDHRGVFNA